MAISRPVRIASRINTRITDPSRLLEFPRSDRIVSGNNTPPSKSFKLLDLPREIRDTIYGAMLCDWRKGPDHNLVRGYVEFDPIRSEIEPNILLANRQIYQEAKLVLLKENQFVHIRMDVPNSEVIPAIFALYNVPVVSTKRGFLGRGSAKPGCAYIFKDLVVMTHHVEFAKDPRIRFRRYDRLDVILLHRDLQQFCKALAFLDIKGPYSSHSKHLVIIHNPFAKTLSPDFVNYKNQV